MDQMWRFQRRHTEKNTSWQHKGVLIAIHVNKASPPKPMLVHLELAYRIVLALARSVMESVSNA